MAKQEDDLVAYNVRMNGLSLELIEANKKQKHPIKALKAIQRKFTDTRQSRIGGTVSTSCVVKFLLLKILCM